MTINSMSPIIPPFLLNQDKIEIVAPARCVEKNEIDLAINIIEMFGFRSNYNISLFHQKDIFAGTKKQRIESLQLAIDNQETKAIFFARGGYGSIQIIDDIDFTVFCKNPKWLVGFSDITTILTHVYQKYKIQSIHGPMPFNFQNTEMASLTQVFNILKGKLDGMSFPPHRLNNVGVVSGEVIGGNLSILCSLIGSRSFMDLNTDSILFIEDVDEYIYHIERMMYTLERSGVLKKIKGLIVGKMSNAKDNKIPFGKTAYQAISDIVEKYEYPVCFNVPIGHGESNYSIVVGAKIELEVTKNSAKIQYFQHDK